MQSEQAKVLQKLWGNTPCDHPSWDKEYYLSSNTGDYICTQCGKIVSPEVKDSIEEKKYGNKEV